MKKKIQGFGDYVIVSPDKPKEVTQGGVIIPQNAQEKVLQGVVISSGNEAELVEGDNVFYSPYAGTNIRFMDEDFIALNKKDILAIIKN